MINDKDQAFAKEKGKDTKVDYLEAINETAYLSVPNAPCTAKLCVAFTGNMKK